MKLATIRSFELSIGGKPVTDTLFSEQITRLRGIFFNFVTQTGHKDPQIVRVLCPFGTPHFCQQLAMCHDSSGATNQHRQ